MQTVVYSNGNQESQRAISLLEALNAQILVYKLNGHFTQRGFESEFGSDAEYPQINIGYEHIGGLKETLKFMKEKGLL